MIPETTLTQIQERVDIVEIVGGYVPLKRAGRSFKAPCPFHPEKTPSFIVNPDKQIFHCFGCGVGGNVFGFLMKIEKRDFRDVVEMLAERMGIEIPKDRPVNEEASKRAALFAKANQAAMNFYHKILQSGREAEKARDYLRRRGIREKTIEDFKIGYAPEAWDSFYRAVKSDVPEAVLEKAGLLIAKKEGGGYYDRFRHRVIFPILDAKGVCVAFGGRVLDDSLPKYLNSPETEIYVKGRHLYGLFQARRAIREIDQAIVVEGYMDLIACHQAGVENVVASLGTALTGDQVRLIKRNTANVIMLYDADKAGEMATLRGLELFLEEGLEVKIVRLAKGHDPDSFIKEFGVERFREELAAAKTLFDFKLSVLKNQYPAGTLEGKVKIANEMVQLFAKVPNEILKAAWTRELSKELSISEEALFAEMRKAKEPAKPAAKTEARLSGAGPVPPLEKILLGLTFEPDFLRAAQQELRAEDFRHPTVRRVMAGLLASATTAVPAQLMNLYKDDPEAVETILAASAEADKLDSPVDRKKSFEDCLLKVRRARLTVEREGLRTEILDAERHGDQNRISQLMAHLEALNKRDRQINEKK